MLDDLGAGANGPFLLINETGVPRSPLIWSVPHAARAYDPATLATARDPHLLTRLEDRFVDRLLEDAVHEGQSALIATVPRAVIDLNRAEVDLDPTQIKRSNPGRHWRPTGRARAGLGLIPTRLVPDGPLWRAPITEAEVDHRLVRYHRPYHEALAEALVARRRRFGVAICLDLHSMPPLRIGGSDGQQVDLVIGDCHGQSAAPAISADIAEAAQAAGLRVARNYPYAGGAIAQKHGAPARGIHVIQLELARSLYLTDSQWSAAGAASLRTLLRSISTRLTTAHARTVDVY